MMKKHFILFTLIISLLVPVTGYSNELSSYFAGTKSLQANFVQRVYDDTKTLQELSSGVLSIKMPKQFRLEYKKPFVQLYLADGKQLWFYDPDLEQVTVRKQGSVLAQTPAMILSDPQSLDKHYVIEKQPTQEGVIWFKLTPKTKDTQFEAIHLAFKNKKIVQMELFDSFARMTQLRFTELKTNPKLPAKTFSFTPPEGVDVIQQ